MIDNTENRVIDLTPNENVDTTQQQESETPLIIIERDNETVPEKKVARRTVVKRIIIACVALLLVVGIAVAGYLYYLRNYYVGMPISCSPSENIEKLKMQTLQNIIPEVVMTSDSIGNVAVNMYEMRGLRSELTFNMPDSTDTDVYFYSRCADYDKQGNILGSMVVDGKDISDNNSRLGYCAMVGNSTVIGIARNEAVRDFVREQGGSFFRQFILVSDGELPRKFHLHKKVERRALARMENQLFYIESRHPETMYDFADAIRRYGFIDAIYITGGNSHSFYRTADGICHDIGMTADSLACKESSNKIPWLVFRKK